MKAKSNNIFLKLFVLTLLVLIVNNFTFCAIPDSIVKPSNKYAVGAKISIGQSGLGPDFPETKGVLLTGITFDYNFVKKIYFRTGLLQFARLKFPFYDNHAMEHYEYLSVPLSIYFEHNSCIYGGLGIGVDYNFKITRPQIDYEHHDPPKWNISIELFGGIKGRINNTSSLFIEAYFNRAFANYYSSNAYQNGFVNIGAALGYLCQFKNKSRYE